jgi:hypothetical protein
VASPTNLTNDSVIDWLQKTENLVLLEKIRFISQINPKNSDSEGMIVEGQPAVTSAGKIYFLSNQNRSHKSAADIQVKH